MRCKNFALLFVMLPVLSFGQATGEIPVATEVKKVVVFPENAQVSRQERVSVGAGTTLLKFVDLSPFIIPNTVQARVDGAVVVLSVNHRQDFLGELEKSPQLQQLENDLEELRDKMAALQAEIEVSNEEIAFLNANRNIGGNEAIDATRLKAAADFYRSRLTELKSKILKNGKKQDQLGAEVQDLEKEIQSLSSSGRNKKGTVEIKVTSKQAQTIGVEVSYLVRNAGWFPSYDIKAHDINSPLELIYKANVRQDTKTDWKKAQLRFSTANPNTSAVKPELLPYLLGSNLAPPKYYNTITQVSGMVVDERGEPLPGVSISLEGSTIATQADFDGRYSLSVPGRGSVLVFSYIGHQVLKKQVTGPTLNVVLEEDNQALEEVVITGYGRSKKALEDGDVTVNIRGATSQTLPTFSIQRQTTVEFEINIPYTILSDNKNYAVEMARYRLPAVYKYVSVPKVDPSAYLIAQIRDWEQYNLLEGEANLYFEDTFVGKSLLDLRDAFDTLEISLGRDKSVSVKREKSKDFSSKKFVGTRRETQIGWTIAIKNNKPSVIDLQVQDQVPISMMEEIKVTVDELSGGSLSEEMGKVDWNLKVPAGGERTLSLRYTVRYPRDRRLYIE